MDTENQIKEIREKLNETNSQATNRIANELRQEKKDTERKKWVFDFFFMLTGLPMTDHEYMLYMKEWGKRETYNIKTFIRDRDLLKDLHLNEMGLIEWGKSEDEQMFHRKEIIRLEKELEERKGKEKGVISLNGDTDKETISR